ncbi:MAG: hypothetical protein K0S34_2555 [Bacillales bacterium]|jgi:hypothetical protein|nr:hypothetical protein [Bacillales bacterium]
MNRKTSKNKLNYLIKLPIIGIFGGMFWGTLCSLSSYFSFTEISPRTLIVRTLSITLKSNYYEHLAGIILITILSVVYTFIYYSFFKKHEGVLTPVIAGILLYCIIFLGISSLTINIPKIQYYGSETFTTILCFFILYSTFIGVSVSYEYKAHKTMRTSYSKNN